MYNMLIFGSGALCSDIRTRLGQPKIGSDGPLQVRFPCILYSVFCPEGEGLRLQKLSSL